MSPVPKDLHHCAHYNERRECFAVKMQMSPGYREGAAWLSYQQAVVCLFLGGHDQLLVRKQEKHLLLQAFHSHAHC